jgi:Tol biopolymer transport system component
MPEKPCFFKRRCYWIYVLLIGFIFSFSPETIASDEAQSARQFSLIQQTRQPEISTDGKSVAFLWDITGQTQVWVYELSRPFPTQVTFFDEPVESVKWIPKSEELVVSVRNSFGNTALYRVDRFGYQLTPLSDKPQATFILKAFSNDGQKLAYASNMLEPSKLDAYILDLKSNISTLIAAENVPVQPVSFSPNGSQLLISKGYPEIQNHLFLVNTKSLKQVRLTDKRIKARYEGGDWTPDGKGFYTATTYKRNQKTLALISLQKRRRKIIRGKISPINLGQSCLISYNLSENGKYFTYTLLSEGKYHTVVQNLKTRRNVELEDAHDIAKVDFTSDSKHFVLTFANATNPTQTLLYDPETKKR